MLQNNLQKLIREAQKGDKKAFSKLLQRKRKHMIYIALSILKNKHDAEDAVQEAAFSMYSHITDLKSAEAFDVWMYRTVFRACLRIKDANRPGTMNPFDKSLADSIPEKRIDFLPYERKVQKDDQEYLLDMINDLPDHYRSCLYLFYYEGMSYNEIAEVLDASVQDVTNWLKRSRKKLKLKLQQDNVEIHEKHATGALEIAAISGAFALDISNVASTVKGKAVATAFDGLLDQLPENAGRAKVGLIKIGPPLIASVFALSLAAAGLIGGYPLFFLPDSDSSVISDAAPISSTNGSDREAPPPQNNESPPNERASISSYEIGRDLPLISGGQSLSSYDLAISNTALYEVVEDDVGHNTYEAIYDPFDPQDPKLTSNTVTSMVHGANKTNVLGKTGDPSIISVGALILSSLISLAILAYICQRKPRSQQ